MISKLIIAVTGHKGTGKTEFSKYLANKIDFQVVNIGNLLEKQLKSIGVTVAQRLNIGATFFTYYSDEEYFEIIKTIARAGVIIDGIRLAWALMKLRSERDNLLHIHLINEPKLEHLGIDGYESEESILGQIADLSLNLDHLPRNLERLIQEYF